MTGGLDDATRPVASAVQPDEATAISRRGAAGASLDDTVRSGSTASAPPGPRRTPTGNPGSAERTGDVPADDVPSDGGLTEDGSTVVARRESRRRQERAHPGQAPSERAGVQVPASGVRVASAPDSSFPPTPVRRAAPTVVPRAAPVARAPQDPVDTAATEESRRRRSRRIATTVVVTASALAVGAATALVILLTMG